MTPTQPPAREAQLTELHLDERGLEFRMKHPIVPIMAEHLAEAFKDAGGVNYVAFDVNCEDIGPLVLTMQRRLGETPEMQVRRLRIALATTQAERDALATELAVLRTPVTDEALVEAAAQAGCETAGLCEPAYEWEHAIKERKAAWRIIARAVLAAVGPALVAAERERCAKIAEAAAWCDDMASAPRDKTLDLFNGKSRVPNCCFIDGRWGLLMNGYHIGVKPTHWRLPPAGPVT